MVHAAIVGFGYMGRHHLQKISELGDARISSVFDVDDKKREEARALGLRAHETLDSLLSDGEIQLIIIATPNDAHARIAVAALRAGKHVLCEKPAVLHEAELCAVLDAADSAKRIFTVHHNRRWDVDYLTVRSVLDDQTAIGQAITVESRVLGQRGVIFGWRADPRQGGGMLYDWGPHLVDQLLLLFSGRKVEAVSARLCSMRTPSVDDFAHIDLYFEGGVCGRVDIGTMALQKLPRWYLYGDAGTLKLDDFTAKTGGITRIRHTENPETSAFEQALGPSRTMAPLKPEQLEDLPLPYAAADPLAFHRNLIDAIQRGASPYVLPEHILRVTRVLDAAFRAAADCQILKVNL